MQYSTKSEAVAFQQLAVDPRILAAVFAGSVISLSVVYAQIPVGDLLARQFSRHSNFKVDELALISGFQQGAGTTLHEPVLNRHSAPRPEVNLLFDVLSGQGPEAALADLQGNAKTALTEAPRITRSSAMTRATFAPPVAGIGDAPSEHLAPAATVPPAAQGKHGLARPVAVVQSELVPAAGMDSASRGTLPGASILAGAAEMVVPGRAPNTQAADLPQASRQATAPIPAAGLAPVTPEKSSLTAVRGLLTDIAPQSSPTTELASPVAASHDAAPFAAAMAPRPLADPGTVVPPQASENLAQSSPADAHLAASPAAGDGKARLAALTDIPETPRVSPAAPNSAAGLVRPAPEKNNLTASRALASDIAAPSSSASSAVAALAATPKPAKNVGGVGAAAPAKSEHLAQPSPAGSHLTAGPTAVDGNARIAGLMEMSEAASHFDLGSLRQPQRAPQSKARAAAASAASRNFVAKSNVLRGSSAVGRTRDRIVGDAIFHQTAVSFDDRPVSHMPVRIGMSGDLSLRLGDLLSLCRADLTSAAFAHLSSSSAADEFVSFKTLRSAGIDVRYDAGNDRLVVQSGDQCLAQQ